jgi:DNA mismatch repair ATPase MutS
MYTKLYTLRIVFVLAVNHLLVGPLLVAQSMPKQTGAQRVVQAMHTGLHGMDQAYASVLYADTKNYEEALNLPELSNRLGCKTTLGKDFLSYSLSKVISPKDQQSTILFRQNLIRLLYEHPELLEKFDQMINLVVEHENKFMKFMDNRYVFNTQAFKLGFMDTLEYVNHTLNRNEVYQAVDKVKSTISLLYYPEIAKSRLFELQDTVSKFSGSAYTLVTAMTLSGLAGTVWYGLKTPNDLKELAFSPIVTALTVLSLYKHYTQAVEIRDALYGLNQLIEIARQIEVICKKNNVQHQFKMSAIQSPEGKNLLQELHTERYLDASSQVFFTPGAHSFAYDVYEHDGQLAPLFASIGELDACCAIARKMKQQKQFENKFCFVQFLDSKQPKIEAIGFWNILISKGTVVVNDFIEDKNVILTGPNEGGKTTAICAILQNIVLAQTFGIAAATSFKLTPFDRIYSYIHVKGDILDAKSRFAAELKMAKEIVDAAYDLPSNEKMFFILDELFTGTNGRDGEDTAYKFIKNIADYSGIQFIYATHFDALKDLGNAHKNCTNYKINPPLQDAQGHFVHDSNNDLLYPFTLSKGFNTVNVALQRALDAGIFKKKLDEKALAKS